MSEIQKGKIKAKRKINALDFSGSNAAVALVSKDQGGGANGMETLVIKAANFSDAFLEKATQVKVTMEFDEFLTRFFGMYYEDAEVLARVLGFEDEEKEEPETSSYEDYIQSRVQSFEILKAVAEAGNFAEQLSKLNEDEYLILLKDQETIEKSLIKADKQKAELEAKAKAEKLKPKVKAVKSVKESPAVTTVTQADVNASTVQHEVKEGKGNSPVVKLKSKEKLMPDVKVVEQVVETEMIEKSQFDAIQKQAADTQELLKSAMQELEMFKAEKQAMVVKARKQSVLDVVKDQGKADSLYGAIAGLADAEFDSVVSIVKSLSEQVEKSALFQEQGATVESTEQIQESAVARILKAQFTK